MPTKEDPFPTIPDYELDYASYLGLNRCAWTVDPAEAVLFIYDMQRWYVGRYENPARLLGNIKRVRSAAHEAGMPVIYGQADPVTHLAERGLNRDLWGDGIGAVKGAQPEDHEIHPELAPGPTDFVIRKRKYSAFYETELEALLRRLNRSQIIMTGNYAHHGCAVTTVDAYMRNFKVFFTADALGAFDAASHDMALRWVADLCGQIALTDDVERAIRSASRA